MRKFDLIAMGRVAVDFYAEQIGSALCDAQTFRKYLGGCAGNIAVGAQRLGLKVSMLSCVGKDYLGRFLQKELVAEGIDISKLEITERHLTGLVVLGVCPPDHFPLIFFRNHCADMAIDKNLITSDYLSQAKALLITGTGLSHKETKDATLHAIKLARSVDTKVILDIDYRPVLWGLLPPGDGENRYISSEKISEEFLHILPFVDVVVGTEEECRLAGGDDDLANALTKIRALTRALIVVKKGVRGATCYQVNDEEEINCQAFEAPIVNVLGAGDAFMAGFLSAYLRDAPIAFALERGNACGALLVSRHGCSHACPSSEELDHFMATKNIEHKNLARLHRRVLLKEHDRIAPMPVLAFCHRWQLEEECKKNNRSFDKIHDFKTALAEVVVDCSKAMPYATMLCDPHYGKAALLYASKHEARVIVAIEKSGARLTEWLTEESAYEILLMRPPTSGVKLLWQFHEGMPAHEAEHQLTKLKELARACDKLDRKLMLELIVPNDESIISAVTRVYQEGVFPYWWKLKSLTSRDAFLQLSYVLDEHDKGARVLILGGEAKAINDFREPFSLAQTTHHGIGFAVGRSIFWPSFCDYVRGEKSLRKAQAEVKSNFLALYDLWLIGAKK